jgi:phospholipid-translocating ATPase
MLQSPTKRTAESGGTRSPVHENGVAAVNNFDTKMQDDGNSLAETMVSDGTRQGARQPVANEPSLDEHRGEPRRPSLDTSSPVLDERLAKPSFALRSRSPAGAGPSTRPQSSRAKPRNRGYSLRRSLFSKNIRSQPGSDGVFIETGSPDSASGRPISGTTIGKYEKEQPSVTVSTFAVEDDSWIPLGPTKFGDSTAERQFAYERSPLPHPRQELLPKLRSSFQKAKRALLRMNEIPPTADGRHINLDFSDPSTPIDERTRRPYVSNVIRSSRYTLLNFFPRQLLAQFSKLANFYFLTVSILQMIPGLSTTGTYTTIIPLLIFVGISMAKEGYDDIRRWRLEKEENNRVTLVLDREWHSNSQDKTKWKSTKWHDVRVGDVLLLQRNDPIPADLALLHVNNPSGAAYIEVCTFSPTASNSSLTSLGRPWPSTGKQTLR